MKRITPPKPEITLYTDGFEAANDMLERKATGLALSDLVERIDEPMVIALDGGWGTGKSFFLQCWVGEHLNDDKHRAQTVYFDAFRHDCMDSPLVSLMGEISERMEGGGKGPTFKTKAIKTLRNAALPLTRDRPTPLERLLGSYRMVIASLFHLKVQNAPLYKKAVAGTIKLEELSKTYLLASSEPEDGDRCPYVLNRAWATFLSIGVVEPRERWSDFDPNFRHRKPREELAKTTDEYLEQFEITLSE